jgi:hypothetical protein
MEFLPLVMFAIKSIDKLLHLLALDVWQLLMLKSICPSN